MAWLNRTMLLGLLLGLLLLMLVLSLRTWWAVHAELIASPHSYRNDSRITNKSKQRDLVGETSPACNSEYVSPKKARLFAGQLLRTRRNMEYYKGFRFQYEQLTTLGCSRTFKIINIPYGGMQFTPLTKAPQDWKTLVLGCTDRATLQSAAWTNWYYSVDDPSDMSLCNEHLPGSAVFFRGFSFGRFVYGAANHDILPPLVWLADSYPDATLLLEVNPDALYGAGLATSEKMKQFLSWFDPALFARTKFVPRGYTVCADSLKVLVPFKDMDHPEKLRSWELFRYMRQHLFLNHRQLPVQSVVYLVREQKDSLHGRWLVPEHVDSVLMLAKAALKRYSRPEQLVVFNGTWEGKTATIAQQYRIFNSAAVAFGPHGTGFSNVIWMPCTGSPAAIEFICSQNSFKVRGCTHEGNPDLIRYASYWGMHGGATWLRYYHVFVYDAGDNLTNFMKVDLQGFEQAMHAAVAGLPKPVKYNL